MNKIGADIMAKFDKLIGEFGNTAEILQEAHEDLAKDNAAAARAEYGRGVSLHESCDYREAALKEQIERLIDKGNLMASRLNWLSSSADLHNHVVPWHVEAVRARELIK